MSQIKCRIKGCPSVHNTEESVSPKATFVCSGLGADGYKIPGHTRKEVLTAIGRVYNKEKDEADSKIKFQDHQFDRELGAGKKSLTVMTYRDQEQADNDPETPVVKAAGGSVEIT
jgi:hypothetical protein